MNMKKETENIKSSIPCRFRLRIQQWRNRVKKFQGDPHFVAMGMAIGVFVAATPSMPFQTAIAVALAFILRSSKAAAAIAVWLSNPIEHCKLTLQHWGKRGLRIFNAFFVLNSER